MRHAYKNCKESIVFIHESIEIEGEPPRVLSSLRLFGSIFLTVNFRLQDILNRKRNVICEWVVCYHAFVEEFVISQKVFSQFLRYVKCSFAI